MNELKYDWAANLQAILYCMKLLGLWPEEKYKLDLYTIYSLSLLSAFGFVFVGFHTINIYFVRNELNAVVSIFYVVMSEYMGTIKVYFIITKIKELKNCLSMINSDWFQPKTHEQKLMIERRVRFWKIICMLFYVSTGVCNTFWMLNPLLDSSDERHLPFLIWYPYDETATPFYEISYTIQFLNTAYLLLAHIYVDVLVAVFNVFIACHFEMIRDNIRNICGDDDLDKAIVDCVIHHHNIMK